MVRILRLLCLRLLIGGALLSILLQQQQRRGSCTSTSIVKAFVLQVVVRDAVTRRQRYQQQQQVSLFAKVATSKVYSTAAVALVPLLPEPLGGTMIEPIVASSGSLGISKMKQLSVLPSDPKAYQFWMTTYADGKLIQEIRQTILKDASKKANFPGFRKGQVPPYAQPQITQFAIQESIIKTVEAMVSSYGLVSLSGSDGQVQVHEDVSEMTKLYKTGTSIQFTATLNAMYDPSKDRTIATALAATPVAAVADDSATTTTTTMETETSNVIDVVSTQNNSSVVTTDTDTNTNVVEESENGSDEIDDSS